MLFLKTMGKRVLSMLLCVTALLSLAVPVSAAMVDLEPVTQDRRVCPVRYRPREDSTVIGNLEEGTPLDVVEEVDGYFWINCGKMIGYLALECVKVDDNGCYYVNSCENETFIPCREPKEIEKVRRQILETAEELLGTPYVYGGTGPWGFDCSGFVQHVFKQADYQLNRTASNQLCNGMIVADDALLPGDIVFFRGTSSESGISSHVGIYIGNGEFIHASSSRGVVVSDLSSGYYAEHFLCARRVILSCVADYSSATEPVISRSSGPVDRSFLCCS